MKNQLRILSVAALILGACTTGQMVSSGGYGDDVYYTPGDNQPYPAVSAPPVRVQQENPVAVKPETKNERAARVVDEYFDNSQKSSQYSDSLAENYDDQDLKDVIGDYSEPDEDSYSSRIKLYIDPYFYNPYWDPFWSYGGFSWNIGWGFGWGGWYDPWYSSWYGPYWGGYYGGGWGYPYYGYGYGYGWGGYYPYYPYYGGGYYGNYYSQNGYYYGRQNYNGRRGSTSNAVSYGGAGGTLNAGTAAARGYTSGSVRTSSGAQNPGTLSTRQGSAQGTTTQGTMSTRQAGTRYTVDPNSMRNARLSSSGQQGARSKETLLNLRRSQPTVYTRQGTAGSSQVQGGQSATRSASTSGSNQRYVPSYSRPRTNTQATYNSGASRQYVRPQTESSSGSSGFSRYAKPQSNYSSGRSVGSSSYGTSGSYQRRSEMSSGYSGSSRSSGSSIFSGRSSSSGNYSAPSRSEGGSYSAPSRSFSGGSSGSSGSTLSAPSFGGGGGGGGSSSGGGGGGGGRMR